MITDARLLGGLLAVCAGLVWACSESTANDAAEVPPNNSGSFGSGGAASIPNGAAGSSAISGGRPPEQENESSYLVPVATGKYLWTANPISGRVALIDGSSLDVKLTLAGDQPTEVVGLPERNGRAGALVLNARSHDATVFRIDDQGDPGVLATLPTHLDANAWSVSPSGAYAIAWTDARRLSATSPLQTFQDITLLTLGATPSAQPLSVGARPTEFFWDPSERYAYAVTDEGISVLSLGASALDTSLIAVSDTLDDPTRRDVSFAADGSYALVRNEGESTVSVVTLPTGERQELELGGVITDLDLDAANQRAVAALGIDGRLVMFPLPPTATPDFTTLDLPEEQFGAVAVSPDGNAALLYSTVLATTRVVQVDLRSGKSFLQHESQDLFSPLRSLFMAPDPRFAVSFQTPPAGSKKAGVFSLLSTDAARLPKLVPTNAVPDQIAFSDDGTRAVLSVRSDTLKTFGAYLIAFENQQVDRIDLESPPLAVGVIPAAERAFVAQAHPEGRITFVSLDGSDVRTVTGFELAARIRE